MSRSRCFPFRLAFVMVATFGIASVDSSLSAQTGATRFEDGRVIPAVRFKEPLASRVYQTRRHGRAEIPIVLEGTSKDVKLLDALLQRSDPGNDGGQVR